MFDPLHIGKIFSQDVKVTHIVRTTRRNSPFKALVTIQKHTHALLLKPNLDGKKDQLIADRMKYICSLQPMHTFGLSLTFVYLNGVRVECDWCEYFAMALSKEEVLTPEPLPTLATMDKKLLERFTFRVELCKIILFRYMMGFSNTSEDHILIRNERPISISEITISSACPSRKFLNGLAFIETEAWEVARKSIAASFDYDCARGIILQTGQPERDLKKKSPKGSIHNTTRRLTEIIENRFDIITSCKLSEFPDIMRSGDDD